MRQGSIGRAAISRHSKISAITTKNKLWSFQHGRLLYGEDPIQSADSTLYAVEVEQRVVLVVVTCGRSSFAFRALILDVFICPLMALAMRLPTSLQAGDGDVIAMQQRQSGTCHALGKARLWCCSVGVLVGQAVYESWVAPSC